MNIFEPKFRTIEEVQRAYNVLMSLWQSATDPQAKADFGHAIDVLMWCIGKETSFAAFIDKMESEAAAKLMEMQKANGAGPIDVDNIVQMPTDAPADGSEYKPAPPPFPKIITPLEEKGLDNPIIPPTAS